MPKSAGFIISYVAGLARIALAVVISVELLETIIEKDGLTMDASFVGECAESSDGVILICVSALPIHA